MRDIPGEVEHRLAILKLHVDVRRIMFVKEHANDDAEEPADLGHGMIPFAGSIVRRNGEKYNGRIASNNLLPASNYGNLKSETNAAVDCLFGFTGRAYDEATGLQDNGNRKYDALMESMVQQRRRRRRPR